MINLSARHRGAIGLFVAVAALMTPTGAGASFPGQNGRIVFESYRGSEAGQEYFDVFSITSSGGDLRRLTEDPATDWSADVSADGRRVAFTSDRDGSHQLYVMRSDGTNVRQLQGPDGVSTEPSWSPDGKRLVYVDRGDWSQPPRLAILRLGDNHIRKLPRFHAGVGPPEWSPDGRLIAFEMERKDGASMEIFTVRPDGTHLRRLTDTKRLSEWSPDWSPDGRSIVFQRDRAAEPGQGSWMDDIAAIDRDGSNDRNLTYTSDRYEAYPAWSPDGRTIAYAVDTTECTASPAGTTCDDGSWEIWKMAASGRNQSLFFRFPEDPISHNEIFGLDWQAR